MKVFISYGTIADQVTALRLQALGAVNGLTVYVPPAHTRQISSPLLDPEISQKLSHADVVLGLVATGLATACQEELNTALANKKQTIVLSAPRFAAKLAPYASLVVIDPANPDQALKDIVHHLKAAHAEQNVQKALVGMGLLALGLWVFASADRS